MAAVAESVGLGCSRARLAALLNESSGLSARCWTRVARAFLREEQEARRGSIRSWLFIGAYYVLTAHTIAPDPLLSTD